MKKEPTPFDPAKCETLSIRHHGGSCCGISHICGFPSRITRNNPNTGPYHYMNCAADGEKRLRYLIGRYWTDSSRTLDEKKNRLYEVVLQSSQRKAWEPILTRIGFTCVTDFKNTNSGNRVFVYHYAMGPDNAAGPYVSPYAPEAKSSIVNPFKVSRPDGRVVHY